MHANLAFLFLLFFSSTVLADDVDFLITRTVDLDPVESLSRDQRIKDLDDFLLALRAAYGGKTVLKNYQFDRLIDDLTAVKELEGPISSENFCNLISKSTEKVNDFHLTVHIGSRTCGRVWPQAQVGENVGTNSTWSIVKRSLNDKSVEILAIKKMSSALSPEWNGFLEATQSLIEKQSSFIIDLRGNPGGDVTKVREMAQLLYGVSHVSSLPSSRKTTYRWQNSKAWTLLANAFWMENQRFEAKGIQPPPFLLLKYQEMLKWKKIYKDEHLPELQVEESGHTLTDISRSFSKPIYVLIDKHCGSSCELFLEALENLPSVITVGEPTTGVVQYGNVGVLYLNESHIVVNIPTQGSIYSDGRNVEKVGYQPKYAVSPGVDALDFTFKKLLTF